MDFRWENGRIRFGERPKAFIFYTGLSYFPNFFHCETGWNFDLDMEFGYQNHMQYLHQPLSNMGYDVGCAIITNKENNPKYKRYLQLYNAFDMNYNGDVNDFEIESMVNYFKVRYERFGAFSFGYPIQGFRFLTIQDPIPMADIYVFIRCDLILKKPLNEINIDYDKINYLWKEEGIHRRSQEGIASPNHPNSGWSQHHRVCGNMLHVVNKKYIKSFLTHFWLEHCSMHAMLKDCDSVTLQDFHIVCGDEMYDSCTERESNPIFTHSRKKVEN
tara:strand:+ start:258 stop:1076 length:819 start_codon:yes stop_codon:yes gene_type:complete